jgi:hypothetical protein
MDQLQLLYLFLIPPSRLLQPRLMTDTQQRLRLELRPSSTAYYDLTSPLETLLSLLDHFIHNLLGRLDVLYGSAA